MDDVRWFAPNRYCTLIVPWLRDRGLSIALDGDGPARVAIAMDAQVAAEACRYAARHRCSLIHYVWDLPPWWLGRGDGGERARAVRRGLPPSALLLRFRTVHTRPRDSKTRIAHRVTSHAAQEPCGGHSSGCSSRAEDNRAHRWEGSGASLPGTPRGHRGGARGPAAGARRLVRGDDRCGGRAVLGRPDAVPSLRGA